MSKGSRPAHPAARPPSGTALAQRSSSNTLPRVLLRYELSISLRYFRSRRSEGAVSFITWVAVVGVSLGVGALVVAMAVMNGYQHNLIRAMAGALPHISLHALREGGLPKRETLEPLLRERLGPTTLSAYVLYETLVSGSKDGESAMQGILVRAIDSEVESGVPDLLAFLDDGSPDWENLEPGEREARAARLLRSLQEAPEPGVARALISPLLARKLGVKIGGRLVPLAIPKAGEGFSPTPAAERLEVAGYFSTDIAAFDELIVLMDISHVDRIFPEKKHRPVLGMRLVDPMAALEAKGWLEEELSRLEGSVYVYSWVEENKGLFQVVQYQKVALFMVLMLIVLLAFFGMTGALVMLVAEKTREITILASLGARKQSILLIFVVQGLLIGIAGTLIGMGLGLTTCWILDTFPVFEIPPGVYPGSDRVPVLVSKTDIAIIGVATFFTCLLATLFPAFKAASLHPIAGLRRA